MGYCTGNRGVQQLTMCMINLVMLMNVGFGRSQVSLRLACNFRQPKASYNGITILWSALSQCEPGSALALKVSEYGGFVLRSVIFSLSIRNNLTNWDMEPGCSSHSLLK